MVVDIYKHEFIRRWLVISFRIFDFLGPTSMCRALLMMCRKFITMMSFLSVYILMFWISLFICYVFINAESINRNHANSGLLELIFRFKHANGIGGVTLLVNFEELPI